MITPSAFSPTFAAWAGVPIPNPTATGTSASAWAAATRSAKPLGSSSRSPVVPRVETR